MSKRPLNELESKLHQAALSARNKELSDKQVESIIPDASQRQAALNFLLGVGLFKPLENAKKSVLFRAVTTNELAVTKDLSWEENLVLGHIKASGNEGIWIKHLRSKTNLHKAPVDRCLKILTKKRLIKRVSSIQYPTRILFMLEGLEPSVSVTGGPWYTDNELDTEFIQNLSDASLKFIRDISFPKRRGEEANEALFSLSSSPEYPSAEKIRNSLKRARLTETDLTVEHVEMLLNVLVLDGEIERLPSFGTAMWNTGPDDDESTDESDVPQKKKKRRKSGKSKGKHKAPSSDSESDDPPRRDSKKQGHRHVIESDEDSHDTHKKRKRKRKKNDSGSSSSSENEIRKRKSKKQKSRRSRQSSSDESSSSEDDSRRVKLSKVRKRSPSHFEGWDELDTDAHTAFVYRAIRQERLLVRQSEAPCSQCPSFDFCKDGGPVNPQNCVYYDGWLAGGTVNILDIDI